MAKRAKQLEFLDSGFKRLGDSFGGSLLKSHPKFKRPLDSKYPTLVTLRSNRSEMRSFNKFHRVKDIVYDTAKKYGIKIYDFANVGNHLHILIKLSHKRFWAPFIREVTSKIAGLFEIKVLEQGRDSSGDAAKAQDLNVEEIRAEKVLESPLKFWKFRPHTRIIRSWKKAFKNAKLYLELNRAEADGNINRTQTKTLKDYRALFAEGMVSIKDPRLLMRV